MHIKKTLFIVIHALSHLLAAPIHDDRRALIEARTVAFSASNIVSVHAIHLQKHIPASNNIVSSSQLHIPVSAARGPSLKLVAQLPPSPKPLVPPLATFRAVRTQCDLKRPSSDLGPSDIVGTVLEFHPDGKNGPVKTTKKATIGDFIGKGLFGSVYNVTSHDSGDHSLVAKIFESDVGDSYIATEVKRLRTVHQLRGIASQNNQTWILMDEVPGHHLKNTEAYKAAKLSGQKAANQVLALAVQLVRDARLSDADKYGLVHTDLHHGNVKYEEHEGKLLRAHLLDWGEAVAAPAKGPDGKFTSTQKYDICWSWIEQYLDPACFTGSFCCMEDLSPLIV